MKVLFISFLLIFVLAQFVLWLKNFFIPLPLYIFGGALLAIASNYEQGIKDLFQKLPINLRSNQKN
ncbi:hypothetical protein ACN4EE_08075 [Geminocystis sp. CENA526]|uniref:hypothetical protein n=1 Tax=Geminocystis sp. CENA526 TaxID=1355871 RepID=UPI003D6E4F5D